MTAWLSHLPGTGAAGVAAYAVALLAAGVILSRLWSRGLRALLEHDRDGRIDRMSAGFLKQVGRVFIWAVVVMLFAHAVPMLHKLATALLASVSIAAVIVGLAVQSTLSNLVAGIGLIFYRPFRLGERVQVTAPTGLETGTVESVSLGYTVLKTWDNRRVVLPNAAIAQATTINLTTVDPSVMAQVPFSIGYGADIARARRIAVELAASHPGVTEVTGCPVVALSASSVDLMLRAWCADAGVAAGVTADLLEAIKLRFDAEGIEIPYAYQNVILHRAPPDAAVDPAEPGRTKDGEPT
jgi:small-conductance mechanosensitive channel